MPYTTTEERCVICHAPRRTDENGRCLGCAYVKEAAEKGMHYGDLVAKKKDTYPVISFVPVDGDDSVPDPVAVSRELKKQQFGKTELKKDCKYYSYHQRYGDTCQVCKAMFCKDSFCVFYEKEF